MANMLSKIVSRDDNDVTKCFIDGSQATNREKTKIDGNEIVQLHKANTLASGFPWEKYKVQEVQIKDILVYDVDDLNSLTWLICQRAKIVFSTSSISISPDILSRFSKTLENLIKAGIKVAEGSQIVLPMMGGWSGYGNSENAKSAAERIGFKVSYS